MGQDAASVSWAHVPDLNAQCFCVAMVHPRLPALGYFPVCLLKTLTRRQGLGLPLQVRFPTSTRGSRLGLILPRLGLPMRLTQCVCVYMCVCTQGGVRVAESKDGWILFMEKAVVMHKRQKNRVAESRHGPASPQGPEIPKSSNATQHIRDP